jgi:RNA polymerase sigma factor (sigma-70 family)
VGVARLPPRAVAGNKPSAGHRSARLDLTLRRVYRDHVESTYAFFAYVVDAHTAQDLTATTFERVVRNWKRYDARKGAERTWILAIAQNVLRDHYRRERHRKHTSLDEYPGIVASMAVHDAAQAVATRDQVHRWLELLNDRERQILALRYGADLEAAEIGRLLDLSTSNVHQILSRTLRKLRVEIGSAGAEPRAGS